VSKRTSLFVLVWLSLATPLAAQPVSQETQRAPESTNDKGSNLSQFLRTFPADVVKGCMANYPKNLRNPRGYCTCYASSFLKRYSPRDLFLITRISGESPQNPRLIALMMAPEIRVCMQNN